MCMRDQCNGILKINTFSKHKCTESACHGNFVCDKKGITVQYQQRTRAMLKILLVVELWTKSQLNEYIENFLTR